MHAKQHVGSRTLSAILGSSTTLAACIGLLTAAPVSTAVAQSLPACAAAWSASAVYVGGNVASENGVNYKANWWTQGNDPATNNGGAGSGQPWTSQGACGGSRVSRCARRRAR